MEFTYTNLQVSKTKVERVEHAAYASDIFEDLLTQMHSCSWAQYSAMLPCWELLEPQLRKERPCRESAPRVSSRWLRRKLPEATDLEDCKKAWELIAESTLEASCEELLSTRDRADPVQHQRSLKQERLWEDLLKRTHRKCAASVEKEFVEKNLGAVNLEPLYPDLKVQEAFLQAKKMYEHVTTYTYHGTKKENISSISQMGFLMPGKGGRAFALFGADHDVPPSSIGLMNH